MKPCTLDQVMKKLLRKSLNAAHIIGKIHKEFLKISDPRKFSRSNKISLTDCLMSGLAVFGLKFPSLLQYDKEKEDPSISANLKNLYHVQSPPSDTYMRERLDEVDPNFLRKPFKKLFSIMQRGKILEDYCSIDGYYFVSVDATGKISSKNIHCPNCCIKEHKDGSKTYYHQLLGAAIVHPEKSNVIPLCPEMIQKLDGSNKNDCERESSKRLLKKLRTEHPHLKIATFQASLHPKTRRSL